jgi:phosphatidylserine/phosphatidylglycerophosphate/cardiolipin synthase-like enzyme
VSCARCSLSSGAGATWHGPSERNLPIPKQRCTTLTLLVGLLSLLPWVATADDFTTARVAVYFSPSGGATDAVVRELNAATTQVLVQAYSFTSAPIAKALLDAHKRGVRVQVILDKSQRSEKYSSADFLANQGVPTMIDANHAIAHNKVMREWH